MSDDQIPTQAACDLALADSRVLIAMVRGRLAMVYFAESAQVPSPNELRKTMRKIRELAKVTP